MVMKGEKKTAKIIIVVVIVIAVAALGAVAALNVDALESVEPEKISPDVYAVVSHMKSGADPEINVSYMLKPLADGVYHLNVVISGRESGSYSVNNLRARLIIPGEPVSEYAACSVPGGYGSPPSVSYDGGSMIMSWDASGGSANLDAFLTGEEIASASLELTYDLRGKGLKLLNGFVDNTVTLELEP